MDDDITIVFCEYGLCVRLNIYNMFSNFVNCVNLCIVFQTLCKSSCFVQIIDLTGISIWYNCLKCIIINVTIVFILYDRSIHLVVACNFSSLACPGSTNIDVGPMLYPDEYNITQYEGRFDEFYQALLTRNYRFGEMPQTPGGKTYSQPISFFYAPTKFWPISKQYIFSMKNISSLKIGQMRQFIHIEI